MHTKRVLLVDDDPDIVETFVSGLRQAGFDATGARDGVEALRFLAEQRFDAVVTDLHMPNISGFQLLSYLKACELNRGAAVFVISGDESGEATHRLSKLGVAERLAKPISIAQLARSIRENLDRKESASKRILAYNPRVIELLRKASVEVLQAYFGAAVSAGAPYLRAKTEARGRFAALIPVFGRRAFGSLAFHGGDTFMTRMHALLLPDQSIPPEQLEPFMADVGLELVNQICGRLKQLLADDGVGVCLGLPELVPDAAQPIRHKVPGHIVSLPITSGDAQGVVELCLGDPALFVGDDQPFDIFLTG